MRKFATNSEYYVLVGAAGLSALVSILDFLGLLEALPWLTGRIPTLILLLVSMVLGYLAVERKSKLEAIEALIQMGRQETLASVEKGVDHIITSLQGVDVRLYEDREEMFASLERAIRQAKRSIDATHFALSTPKDERPSGQRYYDTFSKVVKGGKIKVRRIVLAREMAQLDWMRQMLAEFAGCSFFLGCYPHPTHAVPMMDLLIIDGEKVWFGGGDIHEGGDTYEARTISTRHPLLVKLFQEHFDKLWRDSLRLNERGVRDDLLIQLATLLQQPGAKSLVNPHN